MKKKMCCITTLSGTLESFVIPAMQRFVQEGYDVTLISTMDDKFIEKYSLEFHCINVEMHRGMSLRDLIKKPFEFYRIFKRERFDYVQYGTKNAAWYASVAAWAARVPVRVNCLWGLIYAASSGLQRWKGWLMEKVPCIFSNYYSIPSYKNMEIAIHDGLCCRDRTSVIGDGGTIGVDLKVFNIKSRERFRSEMLVKYPQLSGKTVLGFLGRIDIEKGTNELLQAFFRLNNPNVALMIMGAFDYVRTGLDAQLIEKAKHAENVIFTGHINDVAQHLALVDILVHPTYREGFSMAIQQAMAMGCAIITTDIPGPSEVIEDGISGMLVPSKDADALYAKINEMTAAPELIASMAYAGVVRCKEKFNRERMVQLTYENRLAMIENNRNK